MDQELSGSLSKKDEEKRVGRSRLNLTRKEKSD